MEYKTPEDCPKMCPLSTPFELLTQRQHIEIENLQKDLHRLKDNINGNGKDGLMVRVERLEMQDKTILEKLDLIIEDMEKIKTQAENWRGKVFQALIYISAGGGGVLGLLEILK